MSIYLDLGGSAVWLSNVAENPSGRGLGARKVRIRLQTEIGKAIRAFNIGLPNGMNPEETC
jgi:hypothetical protein